MRGIQGSCPLLLLLRIALVQLYWYLFKCRIRTHTLGSAARRLSLNVDWNLICVENTILTYVLVLEEFVVLNLLHDGFDQMLLIKRLLIAFKYVI